MKLVRPHARHLPSYVAALRRGWSPDTARGAAAAQDELRRIEADPAAFVAAMEDRRARGAPVALPDGSLVPRLPGFRRWMWDGEFVGSIGLRWQHGTTALPPHCLGHVGYTVVPWHRRKGYASAALLQMLPQARAVGLPFIEITTDCDNVASQKVVLGAGGILHETFVKPPQFGGQPALRYRIDLSAVG